MPRVKRRARPRAERWNGYHRKQLLDGLTIADIKGFGSMRRGDYSIAEMRECWNDIGDALLDEWITANPFTRPLGFWLLIADQPRIRVIGEADRAEAKRAIDNRGACYRSCFFESLNARLGAEGTRYNGDDWETEFQYLRRLNLLTSHELELLAK